MRRIHLFAATFLALGCPSPQMPDPPKPPREIGCEGCTVFTGGRVFDGTAISDAALVVEGDRVKEIVPGFVKVVAGTEVDLTGKTVMPGMIDAHVHTPGDSGPYGFFPAKDHTASHFKAFLRSGVTSYLDLGTSQHVIFDFRARLRDGRLLGPRLLAAGPMFTAPGGHPCTSGSPPGDACQLIASPADVPAALGRVLPAHPDVIKIILERGAPNFPLPRLAYEAAAAIQTGAAAAGVPVIAHVSRNEEVEAALDVGITRFAHIPTADLLTEATARRAAAAGAVIVPTVSVIDSLWKLSRNEFDTTDPQFADDVPQEVLIALRNPTLLAGMQTPGRQQLYDAWHTNAIANLKTAMAAGVKLATGTDSGNPGAFHGPTLRRELALYVEAGMTPLAALHAATQVPADMLGHSELGRIAPGALADLLIVNGDPSADIAALAKIDAVYLGGKKIDRDALKVGGSFDLVQRPTTGLPAGSTCLKQSECGTSLYCEYTGTCVATCTTPTACGANIACLPQPGSFTEGYCFASDGCDPITQNCKNGEDCQWLGNGATICYSINFATHGQQCGRYGECAVGHQCDFNTALCVKLCDPALGADAGCAGGGLCHDVSIEAGLPVGHCP